MLLVIAVQLSVLLPRRRPTPSPLLGRAMEKLRRQATAILEERENHPISTPEGAPGDASIAEAAGSEIRESDSGHDAAASDVQQQAAEPPPGEGIEHTGPEVLKSEVLVKVTASEPDAESKVESKAPDQPPLPDTEILERPMDDGQGILTEVMAEPARAEAEEQQVLPSADEPPGEIAATAEAPSMEQAPGIPSPPPAQKDLSDQEKGLRPGTSGIETEKGAGEETMEPDDGGGPTIPDENDNRSDQDAIDDLLRQIEKPPK